MRKDFARVTLTTAFLTLGILLSPSAVATAAIAAPVKDWTGDGRINAFDVAYYTAFMFNPAAGYREWPRGRNGALVYRFNCKETCHLN